MKKYKLIPSSAAGGTSWTNIENAYTDTDSDTYATIGVSTTNRFRLKGFDFSEIPSTATVLSIEIKAKYSSNTTAQVKESINGYGLTNQITAAVSSLVYTFTMTKTISEFLSYKDNIYIEFYQTDSVQIRVYGAEINIVTDEPVPNKVSYGNKILIDLTSDTAIASDVAVGKTFHLASGSQATGTLPPSPSSVTIDTTKSPTTLRELTCIGLTKEPSWFVLIFYASNGGNTGRTKRIMHALYDGTTLATWNVDSTEGAINKHTNSCSFSYSSGTLTLTIPSSINYPYFGQGTWELYYM